MDMMGSSRTGDEVTVVCNPIRMVRWSELMFVCVCYSDEVMREADAIEMKHLENWGWNSQGAL